MRRKNLDRLPCFQLGQQVVPFPKKHCSERKQAAFRFKGLHLRAQRRGKGGGRPSQGNRRNNWPVRNTVQMTQNCYGQVRCDWSRQCVGGQGSEGSLSGWEEQPVYRE